MNSNTLSENFGNLQNDGSENLKIFPNHSETNFVPFRKPSERKLSHTLTVREVARIFEEHDVPITEHTVTNWCKQNSQGICRLDGYYEEAERKWYITPESVDLTIKEERTKLRKDILNPSEAAQNFSEAFGNVRKEGSENFGSVPNHSEDNVGKAEKSEDTAQKSEPENVATRESSDNEKERIRELEQEILNLKILNAGKDALINNFEKNIERERDDRMKLVEVITNVSKENGQLEQKLLALGDGRAAGDNPRVRDAETGQGKPSWSAQPTIQE